MGLFAVKAYFDQENCKTYKINEQSIKVINILYVKNFELLIFRIYTYITLMNWINFFCFYPYPNPPLPPKQIY